MPKITLLSKVINDAVRNLATLFKSKASRKTVRLSLECLEDKLLLTGMALLPHRPLLNDGGILTEHAFTPSASGFGIFSSGDLYSTSNLTSFTYVEHGYLNTDINYGYGSYIFTSAHSEYSLEVHGSRSGNSVTFPGTIDYTYEFAFNYGGGISEIFLGEVEAGFSGTSALGLDNILFTNLVSLVLYQFNATLLSPSSLVDIYSTSTGTFSYEYTAEGVSSLSGDGSSQIPFLPLGYSGVDSYQYSGVTTYAIEKTGNGTVTADNWFKIDGAGSYSTLPDYTMALVCYSYDKDATLSITSSATSVFTANGTSSLIFSTQETFSANGSQAGGSYSYSSNYNSSGRETYSYSAAQTEIYNESAQGSLSESSVGTFSYSGSTPTQTRLVDSLVESVAGTYSLNKYSHREITDGTGQRLSTITVDANGSTSNGKLSTDGTAALDATRSDTYAFSGTANSTISYTGAASSTWDRPNSFTQAETYSYSASYQESRSASGSSLQTMLGSSEAGATFSHAGLTFTQEGVIDSREIQSRTYSETSSTTSSSSGLGHSNLSQVGMPRDGAPSMSSFSYSANGTSSLLTYQSIGTMNFSGTASSRETYSSSDAATLNRLSPFLETITATSLSSEAYTAASTFNISSGLLVRSALSSYSQSYSQSAQGSYANDSYSLSSVAFDSITTGSNYYSETQSYNLSTGSFLGTHTYSSLSQGTLTAAGPATLLGNTSSSSSLNASSSYSFQGSSVSNALLSTQYSESNSLRGTFSNGSYSFTSLVNHTSGVSDTSYESTDIFEITSGRATFQYSSDDSQSRSVTSGNNGLVSSLSGSNANSSTATSTLFFTQYNIYSLEGTSRVTFSLDEYGSASHMTLSLTSINYQESASGLVTSTLEQRNHSSSLLTANDYFSYDANESISLTGSATDFTYSSGVRSGDALGCITDSSAIIRRSQESRSTLTSSQVTDFVYTNHVLGEYLNGKYSFSSMAYSATASVSSVATAYSVDTVTNSDTNYLLDANPSSNSSISSNPGDGTTASNTSSSLGASRATVVNDLLSVTSATYTNQSSHLETYSSLGVYSNFSTSITSFANHSSGQSISTITFTETLTGSIVETSLANSSLTNGNGSATGGDGIRASSGSNGNTTSSGSTTTITFNTSTTGYSHSQLEYESRQEGLLPSNLELELTYYESMVSASSQEYAQEIEDTEYSRMEEQVIGSYLGSNHALSIPGFIGPVENYDSNAGSDGSTHTVTITTVMERVGTATYSGEQAGTSYEYGTYSDGDFNLTSASYFNTSNSSASLTHATSSETDVASARSGASSGASNEYARASSDVYLTDIDADADDTDHHTDQQGQTSSYSVQSSTQLRQGTYSNGSYSYSCIAYDSHYDSSQTMSSTSSYSSSSTIHARTTHTELIATLGKWNNYYRSLGFVLPSWYAEYTQTLSVSGSDSSTISNSESYTSTIRGTSSGYNFSFSLISSTSDSFTTSSYSSSSTASSTYTGEHTTGVTGVLETITGVDASSVSSHGTTTLHINKQHLGLMVNGLATIVYDKTTVDTSNSLSNGMSQSSTLEGHHADFDVYQYDYSGFTATSSQSAHKYSQVAFDSTTTNPWSLASYNSIQTVSNGASYDNESVFTMWHHITTSGGYSVNTWLYSHHMERSDSGSSNFTTSYQTRGHSTPDGSGGYSFVFDHYSVSNSYSEESDYSNEGYASVFSETTNTPPVGPPSYNYSYSRFDWDKERERSGSESNSIAGSTSGATFQYTTYSKNSSRDDTSHFEGSLYGEGTGFFGASWSRDTLVYDDTMNYDYVADADDYSITIEYVAPWTLVQSGTFFGPWTTTGTVTKDHTESEVDLVELPPVPVELAREFDEVKTGYTTGGDIPSEKAQVTEYYGLGVKLITMGRPYNGEPRIIRGRRDKSTLPDAMSGYHWEYDDNMKTGSAYSMIQNPGWKEVKDPPPPQQSKPWFPSFEAGGNAFLDFLLTLWPSSLGGPASPAQRAGQLAGTSAWVADSALGGMKWTYRFFRHITGGTHKAGDLDDVAEALQKAVKESASKPPPGFSRLQKAEFKAGFGPTYGAIDWAATVIPFVTGLTRALLSKLPPGLANAVYAQVSFREGFSKTGKKWFMDKFGLSINTIDDLVAAIRSGKISPKDLPVHYIIANGKTIIINTRTAEALKRAGIPSNYWKGINKTGDKEFERLLREQLERNGLDYDGFPYPPIPEKP